MTHPLPIRSCWAVFAVTVFIGCAPSSVPTDTLADSSSAECTAQSECTARQCHTALCENGTCQYTPTSQASCDDADLCTVRDTCDEAGVCQPGDSLECVAGDNPCVSIACVPATGLCEESPNDGITPPEDVCHTYECKWGKQRVASQKHSCDEQSVPAHGCVDSFVCDPNHVNDTDGSPCKPLNRPDMTSCSADNGDRVIASTQNATEDIASECGFHVCLTPTEGASSECINSTTLSPSLKEAFSANGSLPQLSCSVPDLEAEGLGFCNVTRCACLGDDCTKTAHAVCTAIESQDAGEICDTGNPCEISQCQNDVSGQFRCMAIDEVDCDQYPESTCDTWLACDPAIGGCPLVMLTPQSHKNCHTGNSCIIEEETFCDPSSPSADAKTGCVTKFLQPGTSCSLGIENTCIQDSQCLPNNETELVCQSTGALCDPSSDCRILVGCEVECDYLKLSGTYCDDGIACTDTALCEEGNCVGVPAPGACDDGDPCTEDTCSQAAQGCAYNSIPGCANSVCEIDGATGETVTCKVHLVRANAATPYAVGGRVIFEYSSVALKPVGFRLNACDAKGDCNQIELTAEQPGGAPPPHALATHPAQLDDWNGYGVLYIIPGPSLDPISVVIDKPGFLPKGKHTFEVDLLLKEALPPEMAVPFGLVTAKLSAVEGSLLVGSTGVNRIDLCVSQGCPQDECGDEPYPDGCGGVLYCPCETACDYHGCAHNAALEPAKRAPHSGDINNDGKVDFADSSLYRERVWEVLVGAPPSASQAFPDACIDLNCDGLIDPLDLTRSSQLAIAEFQANWGSIATDFDDDGVHDRCDNDDDNDGVPDVCEWTHGSNPYDKTSVPEAECASIGCGVPTDACFNVPDLNTLTDWSQEFEGHCVDSCPQDANHPACLEACIRDAGGLSDDCSYCRMVRNVCVDINCSELCEEETLECLECGYEYCDPSYAECTGFETVCDDDQDNNADGFIDCLDPSCNLTLACTSPAEPGPCKKFIETQSDLDAAIEASLACSKTCSKQEVYPTCMETCLELNGGLNGACQDCFYVMASCSLEQCSVACAQDDDVACAECIEEKCGSSFQECTKIEFEVVGACENPQDKNVNFMEAALSSQVCLEECKWQPENPECLSDCIMDSLGLSKPCVDCYTVFLDCSSIICEADCEDGFGPACGQCSMLFCGPAFESCSGVGMFDSP